MSSGKKRVILDVDVGSDDAYALMLLIYAEKLDLVKIEAVVCSMGNASLEDVSRNTVRVLEALDRTDIPVYKGVVEPLIPPPEEKLNHFHGLDGFGDLEYETEPNMDIIRKETASEAMHELVVNNPKEITLVCLGPLTNAAITMKLYEDFAENIKEIFIMGGNYAAMGNITEAAEFNFFIDPESACIVLDNTKCLVTLVTWETCVITNISFEWRFDVLGQVKNPFMELLNRVERSIYPEIAPDRRWHPCDAYLVVAMLYPGETITRQSTHNATVELHGGLTRGQIVLDHLKQKEHNVTVLEKLDDEFLKNTLLKAAQSL